MFLMVFFITAMRQIRIPVPVLLKESKILTKSEIGVKILCYISYKPARPEQEDSLPTATNHETLVINGSWQEFHIKPARL